MCGFFITNNPKINSSHLDIVESLLRFRGPDYSSGFICKNGWTAYHARLSIIDLTEVANQPVIDDNGGMLVFNGEILNYKELGIKYLNKEYKSDTLLLSALLQHNLVELEEFDGFFSFVYVNKHGVIEYAVRDKFGVKPLFYHKDKDGYLSFCSEPNVLRSLFDCTINDNAIEEYYSTRYPIFSGSYFNGIYSVLPGSCYINGIYFDITDYFTNSYNNVCLDSVLAGIKKGVETRKISDAPVGLLLSRGVDSNLINSLSNFDAKYSIGFKGDEDIEYLSLRDIDNLKIIECDAKKYKDAFEYLLNLRGEPMSVPNEVLLYLVAKEAANDGIKVLLSGEGADEFFGGYDRIFTWALMTPEFILEEFLTLYCYKPPKKNSNLIDRFNNIFEEVSHLAPFEKVRWFFIKYHMPILFRRLDFSLMAAGVEGREPLANMHVFMQAIKIAPSQLMESGLGKVPLRNIISDFLGKEFAFEKKVGFPVDLRKIFNYQGGMDSYDIWFTENLKGL
ncbi:asparagine synthetase B [Kluyvera ascorbata]|uniref:asparagine synthetase B n=1 Tax=Kluyvera ascorbata TaxID=51288 RepID=UPI0034D44B3C